MDKIGASAILLGPAESAARLTLRGRYEGPQQIDEGIVTLAGGLTAWNAAKYSAEHDEGRMRSPLVHLGRACEVGGTAHTALQLSRGDAENIFRTFGPAALGVCIGAFLEYVAGPVHENFSRRYRQTL